MSFFPIIELVDRWVIAQIKFEKTGANQQELDFYNQQITAYNIDYTDTIIQELYTIHCKIWSLESELKSGQENCLSLEEIGRRAIEIRNWNNRRVSIKNQIAERLNCPVREIKHDHLSESERLN